MASPQTRKPNGRANGAPLRRTSNGNGKASGGVDTHRMRERADQVTHSASGIARIADAVFEGAETQIRSLDEAVAGINQIAASLRETAQQTESVSESAEEL
jgi:methyl-accepting chemotaxis protein